jgi:hypothetical protein
MKIPGRSFLFAAVFAGGTAVRGDSTHSWMENLHWSASGSALWVENISRTSYVPTRKNAMSYEFTLGAGQSRQIAPAWLLDFGADVNLLAVPEFDRTNFFSAGPRLGLQHKFGLGPLAPVIRFDAAYTYKSARIQANSGGTAEAGLRLSKRLNESLKVAASGQWLEHYANSATFDIQQRTVSVEATWDINEHWRLNASAGWLSGRIVANAAWSVWQQAITGGLGPIVYNYYDSIPWEVTDSYGPRWVSYNVEAHADLWTLSLDYALSEHTTLELRAGSVYVVNHINIRYPTDSWGLSLIHRF